LASRCLSSFGIHTHQRVQHSSGHLRRLEVLPGMTGPWQVQTRQDPSFDSYISLDTAYIRNWSIWLDLKILVRTLSVVVGGTGY
jgi:lipopolysaccharide/colanic/teichoic acid biosynthesis glycosyltransferase